MALIARFQSMRSIVRVGLLRNAYSTAYQGQFCVRRHIVLKDNRAVTFKGLSVRSFCEAPKQSNVDLNFEDFQALMKSGDIQLIDVRPPTEIEEYGAFPNAINIPLGDLLTAFKKPDEEFAERYHCPKPQPYHRNIVFCGKGPIRTKAALELAQQMSYKKVRHYVGGWDDYHKQMGLPYKKNSTE